MICINLLLRGLTVYWLYWLNLRQYTLNLYSAGELCRFSINKSPAMRTLCSPVSIQVCLCGTWKLWGRWSIWTNNSAIIDSLIRSKFWKFRFYIEWILHRTVFAIQLFKSITLSEIFQIFFSQYFILRYTFSIASYSYQL